MNKFSTYLWPGETHFGAGTAGLAGQEAAARGCRQAFILTDPGVMAAGLLEPVTCSLDAVGVSWSVHDAIPPNPEFAAVDGATAAYRQAKADLVIGIGGGSVLDAAKGVRLLAGAPPDACISEYLLLLGAQARPVPDPRALPPMLAIPTTAGTGSEVTPWGVLTDPVRKLKCSIGGPYLIPTVALVDPELTRSLPPGLTAATGFDALSHCIEAYVSTNHNPVLDPMILYGIELVGRSLRRAVKEPGDPTAREDMMLAALIGGIAISSKWLGACHSLAHQLSGLCDLHHGIAIALMLPGQMAFSLSGAPDRYARIAAALDGITKEAAPERAVDAVRALIADIGLPSRLRDVGVAHEAIPALAAGAYVDLNWTTNPRPITEADMARLYEEAY